MVNGVRIGRRWEMRENRLWTQLNKGAREPNRIINVREGRDSEI
jgi:hypothetical protein